jgi:signal transduction histidine kinase/ligand-binding sensor domain-containing protein
MGNLRAFFCVIAAIWSCAISCSPCFGLALEQLNHRAYSAAEGAPSLVTTIAQSQDGMLWLGTLAGLFRFDGVRFVRYPEAGDDPLPSSHIRALLASPDGGLWIGFLQGGISHLHDGHVTPYALGDDIGLSISQFARDHEGVLWAVAGGGLARFNADHWELAAKFDRLRSFAEDSAGRVWVASTDHVFVRNVGQSEFNAVADVSVPYNIVPFVAASPQGRVWAMLPGGILRRLDPEASASNDVERLTVQREGRWPVLFDKEGNLLFGGDALYRIPADQLTRPPRAGEALADAERFSHLDGLSAGFVSALFQDREGNIWVATNSGIDRFSDTNAVRLKLPLCNGIGYALAAGEGGALFAACPRNDAEHGSLSKIRNGLVVEQRDSDKFTTGYRDAEGQVWFGGRDTLAHIDNGIVAVSALPSGLRGRDMQLISRDRNGSFWISMMDMGVFRVVDGHWDLQEHLPKNMAIAATTDAQGAMWFGYTDNRVVRVQGDDVHVFEARNGLKIGHVTSILAQGNQVWAGGELGFERLSGDRFVAITSGCNSQLTGVSGIVSTKDEDLWLNAIGGIVHIQHDELEHLKHDSAHPVQCEVIDSFDGVPGFPIQTRPQPTALATTDGKLWFALSGGIISIDPNHLIRNSLPPPVTIRSIASAGKTYGNRGVPLILPRHTKELQVNYAAGSLTIPERVHFRYKLGGLDKDWQDAGSRREAVYTNLNPGHYEFRVTASNNDGVWNEEDAMVQFEVPPAFVQTKLFLALCVAFGAFSLWLLFAFRMRQAHERIRSRLEDRLAERERIALDLHDTFFQGVQGLLLRFNTAANILSPREPARAILDETLKQSDKVMLEGREIMIDLRTRARPTQDIAAVLALMGESLAREFQVEFRVAVLGEPVALHSVVFDEARLIGQEMLFNAFRHAHARVIEADLNYTEEGFAMRIRDDGVGVDADVLKRGFRPGHLGLSSMRERAAKIGGQVEIWTRSGAGTEIELRVPASAAYGQPVRLRWYKRLTARLPGAGAPER